MQSSQIAKVARNDSGSLVEVTGQLGSLRHSGRQCESGTLKPFC